VAQALVLREPTRARTLTLIGTWGDTDDVWGDQIASLAAAEQAPDRESAVRVLFEGNVSAEFARGPGNFEEFAQAAAAATVPTPVVLHQMTAAAAHDVRDRLAEIDVPTLVIHGEQDGIIRFAAGQRLAQAIPGATLEPLPGRGHHVAWEDGDRVADLIVAHTG
jgi:3-oxoadipate enol-lactonase